MENIKCRMLLVEDDKLDQAAFKRFIETEKLAYDYSMAGSVAEAHDILSQEQFDIVISDYSLGDGTAFDVMESVKDTPVVIVTGAGNEEVATKALRAGASDYLVKDVERNYLKTVPVTVEKVLEHKALQDKLRLLSHAVMSSDDSIYITDMEDKITFVNRAFSEVYGYKEEEIVGKDCNVLWQQTAHQVEGDDDAYNAVSGWEVGFFHTRKDGNAFPISLSRSAIKNEKNEEIALVAISRDISERMEIEGEFRTSNQELKKQNRLKRELAIVVCHKLLQIVNELKDAVYKLTTMASGKKGADLRDSLSLANNDISRAKDIIDDFLEMSRADDCEMNVELNEFSLRSVVSQVLKALAPLATEKGIDLKSAIPTLDLSKNPDWNNVVTVLAQFVGDITEITSTSNTAPTLSQRTIV